jgi:hypothetical protein
MRLLRTFREMLGLLSRGDFSRKLDEEMENLVATLEAAPGDSVKAEMTVKIVFKYELGRLDIDPTYKVKLPDTARFMKTPFWTVDGQLSVEHPSQVDMFSTRSVPSRDADDGERDTA